MKQPLLTLAAIVSLCLALNAQPALLNWVGTFPVTQPAKGILPKGVVIDNNGNCIVSGDFDGQGDFAIDSSQYILSPDSTNAYFIAKYSPSGTLLWANTYQAIDFSFIIQATCDENNDIIIIGTVYDTVDVDPSPGVFNIYPTDSVFNYFIMKVSENGGLIWAKTTQLPSSKFLIGRVAADNDNNIYLSGDFRDTIDFDFGPGLIPDTATGTGSDGYLLKLDPAGNYLWHKCIKGNGTVFMRGIAFDSNSNLYITGSFTLTADFDPGPGIYSLASLLQSSDGFVLTLDENGNFKRMWKVGEDSSTDGPGGIVIDENDFIYVTGSYNNITFTQGNSNFTMNATGSSDSYLGKMDTYGNIFWVIKVGTYINGSNVVNVTALNCDATNGILIAGYFSIDYDFDPSLTGIYNVAHNNGDAYILKLDVDGNFKGVHTYSAQGTDNIYDLDVSEEGNIYAAGYFRYAVDFDPGPGQHIINSGINNDPNGFITSLGNSANFASGNVFRDMNLNGAYDSLDFPIANSTVNASGGSNFITDNSGNYLASFDTGTIMLTYNNLPALASAVPSFYSISNSGFNNYSTGRDFAVQVPGGTTDGSILITNINLTRAGRISYLEITYKNKGSVPVSGEIKLVKDPLLSNVNSSIAPSLITGDTMWWNFSNLMPFETRTIQISGTVSITASIGDVLTGIASLNLSVGDMFSIDNSDTLLQVVRGSYDPNDKQVIPEGGFTTQQVYDGDYLEYIIRFQNTGNDTAFLVQVIDTISSFLDLSTFEMLTASHPYILHLNGNNILRFIFNNILLPDSNVNEEMSHGFLRYRIKPYNNVVQGDIIDNTADIYFDFNDPVITNTVSTEIVIPVGIAEFNKFSGNIFIYPNPVSSGGELNIYTEGMESVFEIYNVSGQRQFSTSLPAMKGNNKVFLPQLPAGIYQCRILNAENIILFKLAII